jgi:hypothetical protein
VQALIFLVGHPTAIVDHTEEHQRRGADLRAYPRGLLDRFEVRGAQVKLPTIIAVFCLEADRGWLPQEAGTVEASLLQIPVDGGPGQAALGRLDEPVRGLEAEVFQQPDGFTGREVTLLLVGGLYLDVGDQFAIGVFCSTP